MTIERTCINLPYLPPSFVNTFHHVSLLEQQDLPSRDWDLYWRKARQHLNAWPLHGITPYFLPLCRALLVTLLKDILMLYLILSLCSPWSSFLSSNSRVTHKQLSNLIQNQMSCTISTIQYNLGN